MWRLRFALRRLLPSSSASLVSRHSHSSIPMVIEQKTSHRKPISNHTYSSLLKERIVFINGPISDETASLVVKQLLILESDNPSKPIHLHINSPGGVVTSGLAIYDIIQCIRSPVATLCVGQAASMGSLLLAAGAPGERRALPNSRIMADQLSSSGFIGRAEDIAIHAKEMVKMQKILMGLFEKHTGQPSEKIEKFLDGGAFLSPVEAKEFGLIDEVIEHRPIALVKDGVDGESGEASGGGGKE